MKYTLSLLLILLAGCASPSSPDTSEAALDETRFTRDVLVEDIDEPMQMDFDETGRVYWVERKGGVRRYDGSVTTLGTIPTDHAGEGGLLGLQLAPDFATSRHIYFYFGAPGEGRMHLSRLTLGPDDALDLASEIVLLTIPYERGSHMGGGMTWDAAGNLYLSTGDNSDATQYTPIHWTAPGGVGQDAQRSAANTNDLRGKILRIHPEPDGRYTIPDGNLFPPGTAKTRPEIYTMGDRNPWRVSIDSKTGYLHWGEVGPDAGADSSGVGPRGYDEFNIAKAAGNFGWPYGIGYGLPYNSYDYEAHRHGEPFDLANPINPSPNNTGLTELPPAQPAFIAYPYGVSEEYPQMNSGGRNAVGGPIFHRSDFPAGATSVFPDYFEDRWFIVDFVRNWIMTVAMDDARTKVLSMERFLPAELYSSPIDMDFGPNGELYVLEYGTQWFRRNADARLSRISYNAGNRAPIVRLAVERSAGAVPFDVRFTTERLMDYDNERLTPSWRVIDEQGEVVHESTFGIPKVVLNRPGIYQAILSATDAAGAIGSDTLQLIAGNEPPEVALRVAGNQTFYFPGTSVSIGVDAQDREDGAGVQPEVTYEYVPAGMTPAEAAEAAGLPPDVSVRHVKAETIIAGSDCRTCHTIDTPSAGPAFRAVAQKYRGDETAPDRLAQKIVRGGSGVWGELPMPAHPALTPVEAGILARYVLDLAEPTTGPMALTGGSFTASPPKVAGGWNGQQQVDQPGSYFIRAAYTDRGANGVPALTARDAHLLRYPLIAPETADFYNDGVTYTPSRDPGFIIAEDGAYAVYRGIDLTGVGAIEVHALTRFYTWSHFQGGTVEVRLDAPDGPLAGPPAEKPVVDPEQGLGGGDQGAPSRPVFFIAEPPATVALDRVSGIHDLYLVFRNPAVTGEQALMLLTGIGFTPAP
ncbi:MAG: PQQ-dependent sugar dehydrogenase [Rhodothermales bacterium]